MGIQNLLPFVSKACRQGIINEFAGCSVAIDTSCLLHRGLFGCMEDIAVGKQSKAYVHYVKKYVDALIALNCHVILVFDGQPLPAKKDTNDERRARRQENMRQGEILLSQGKTSEAGSLFRQSTSITRDVVESMIQHFREVDCVDIIVAPYESDAQLAFLTREKLADVVVTEDSDLIVFGCEKIIFKWDVAGPCSIYERARLPLCFTGKMSSNFDFTLFRRMCILSGCDYLQGLKGVGLSKAQAFFAKTSNCNLREILPRVPSYLRMPKLKVTKEFVQDFIRAENTFIHQVVYDPRSRCQRPLNPYPIDDKENNEIVCVDEDDDEFVSRGGNSSSKDDYSYAGTVASCSQSTRLALGNTAQGSRIEDPFHLPSEVPHWSVWSDHYETRSQRLMRVEEERKEEKKKERTQGAFALDASPVKRKKEKKMVEAEEGEEEEFVTLKRDKKIVIPHKEKTLSMRKLKKNEANASQSIEELITMYEVEETTATTKKSTVDDMEVTVEEDKSTVTVVKTATGKDANNRKRSRLEALEVETKEEEGTEESELPSPINKCTPSPPLDPSLPLSLDLPSPLIVSEEDSISPSTPSSSFKTSTPLSSRSKSLLAGRSAYFGMGRSPSVSNPFKKPRLAVPISTPPPSSSFSSPIPQSPGEVLNTAMIGSPKISALADTTKEKLDIGSSSFASIFRSGCRAAGLRRSSMKNGG